MPVKGPTGYDFWAACGNKEEAQKAAKARAKYTGKKDEGKEAWIP